MFYSIDSFGKNALSVKRQKHRLNVIRVTFHDFGVGYVFITPSPSKRMQKDLCGINDSNSGSMLFMLLLEFFFITYK